ncbi:hypothetical protein PYW08_001461 [Mythimna loreyi]|uniref:Uncharacterized protein n=1 Tax=Mythimna loreyi TaxID=667449 RepID=A0ACC2R8C2_9NEOP|nr:hypothetical protein PYW08_001461 [Mythimna loreyi]
MFHSPGKKKFPSDTDISKQESAGEPSVAVRTRKQPEPKWAQPLSDLSTEIKNMLNDWRRDFEVNVNKISDNVLSMKGELSSLTQITTEIRKDINALQSEQSLLRQRISEIDKKYEGLAGEMDSLKSSVEYAFEDHRELCKKLDSHEKQLQGASTLAHTIQELDTKINSLEQSARNCNIEICNVPEKRNENLITLMQTIGSVIKCNIQQSDIVSVHRVPHADHHDNKPKNIIAKLSSRILRDNILSANRLCKGFTSEKIGISGTIQPVYMHEHLTLKNKRLFRECRDAAKTHGFKFLWVKHGTIFARENETSKAFAIRSLQDISKIKLNSRSQIAIST